MCAGFINQRDVENVIRNADRPAPEAAALQLLDEITAEMANLEHLRQRSIRQMERALRKQEQLQLDRVEETMNLCAMALVHPITVSRALMQFGFEPFPGTIGRKFWVFGEKQTFLPNIFSYMRQLSRSRNLSTLFEGLDSAICVHIVSGTVDSYMWNFLGFLTAKTNVEVGEEQSLSTSLKFTLRLTLTDLMVKIVTRPFKVVMLRQIACIIGSAPVFSTMRGLEMGFRTGWTDLYSGLSTELRNVLLGSFFAFLGRYAINRWLFNHSRKTEKEQEKDKNDDDELVDSMYDLVITMMSRFTELGLSVLFQCTIGCPLEVTSKIRAIAGTSLPIARMLPSECQTHRGAWNFLSTSGSLFRGFGWFFRTSPIVDNL